MGTPPGAFGVIVNPRSGTVERDGLPRVRRAVEEALPNARIHVLEQDDTMSEVVARLRDGGAECVAGLGGDGTISGVAAELVDTPTPLGVLPGGTLNHFARDVGVGRNMDEALRVLQRGYVAPVDVASVNGHFFLNNSSIGLYPQLVETRERYEQQLGKWRAMIRAALLVARNRHALRVRVDTHNEAHLLRTYLLFVGNNQYELDLLHLGERACIDGGELCVFALKAPNRLRLLPYVFRLLRGTTPDRDLFVQETTADLSVAPRGESKIEVSADGEVLHLAVPLAYRIHPLALRVVVPEPPPKGSREERDAPRPPIHRRP